MKNAKLHNEDGGPDTGKALVVGAGVLGLVVFWPQIKGLFSGSSGTGTNGGGGSGSTEPPTFASSLAYSYWLDLYNRGGDWLAAAAEFATLAKSLTNEDQIESTYTAIFNKYTSSSGSGGTGGSGTYDNTAARQSYYNDLKNRTGYYWAVAAEEFFSLSANCKSADEVYQIYLQIYNKYQSGMPTDQFEPSKFSNLVLVSFDGGEKDLNDIWTVTFSFEHIGQMQSFKDNVHIDFNGVKLMRQIPVPLVSAGNDWEKKKYTVTDKGVFDTAAFNALAHGAKGTLVVDIRATNDNTLLSLTKSNAYTFVKPTAPGTDVFKAQMGSAWNIISGCGTKHGDDVFWCYRNQKNYVYDSGGAINTIPGGKCLPGDVISCYCTANGVISISTGTFQLIGNRWNGFTW